MSAKKSGSFFAFISDIYRITRPFGLRRLIVVFFLVLMQAFFQVVGVGSVYPFLAMAADPYSVRTSALGSKFINYLPQMSDSQLLLWTGIGAITLLLVSNAANLISEIGRVKYARGYGHWLSVRLLGEITSRPYGYFLQSNSGELFKKVLNDVPSYVNGVLLHLLEAAAKAIMSIVLVIFLVILSPSIAVGATLLFGTFYVLSFRLLKNFRRRISQNLKTAKRGVSKEASQLLGAIKPVKVHDVPDYFLKRFAKHSDAVAKESAWVPLIGNGTRYIVEPLAFGGLVVVILVMSGDQKSFAQLVPALGVMALAGYRLLPAIQTLYSSLNGIFAHTHLVDEIVEEFEKTQGRIGLRVPKAKKPAGPALPPLAESIEVRNLSFQYPESDFPVIDDLSFTIPAATSFAVIGRTGSGKSTLVDVLLGLHTATGGQILLDGAELTETNSAQWRSQIGYVPQEIFLLDDTIAANIAFGLPASEIDRERLREAADRAQILNFIENELPHGFGALVGERGVRLSGGQRQRIGLARALYRRPKVLILDEATSALDVDTEAALVEALEELHGTLTMIVIAHRLSTIERCDLQLNLDARPERDLAKVV